MNDQQLPDFDLPAIADIVKTHYGLCATSSYLPGERDRNALLQTSSGDRYVLKIYNAAESLSFLQAETQALRLAADSAVPSPRIVPSLENTDLIICRTQSGQVHYARLVTFVPGTALATIKQLNTSCWKELGKMIGCLDGRLSQIDAPVLHRDFQWNLDQGAAVVEQRLPLVADENLRCQIAKIREIYQTEVVPLGSRLRSSTLHGDLNDHNLFLSPVADAIGEFFISGVIDFGDMSYGKTINDLAIAAAYAILQRDEPLEIVAAMVAGFHEVYPLNPEEIAACWGLIGLRLAVSLCQTASQQTMRPDDPYLSISYTPICETLPGYLAVPYRFAVAQLRMACGLRGLERTESVINYLQSPAVVPEAVMGEALADAATAYLDWSAESDLLQGDPQDFAGQLPASVSQVFHQTGAKYLIGGFTEPRLVYSSDQFANRVHPYGERRTIHLGLDVFAPAGSSLFAPFDATVADLAEIDEPLDYGGAILLRHETNSGEVFFTLYGHLRRDSVRRLRIGQPILAGEPFAQLGDEMENGGWPPHLHLQVMVDDLGLGCQVPGVCRPSDLATWRELVLDPNLILGLSPDQLGPSRSSYHETLKKRKSLIGPSVRTSYQRPLKMVRGWQQYLYDHQGRRYLDAYNNVPHVGHAHPEVIAAAVQQMNKLNTNTRYLSDTIHEFAERLTATMPDPLKVCYFVNSASEANELALRLARTFTGGYDMIVTEGAYHGHTSSLIDLSPYKHAGPGGQGSPNWVHTMPLPDSYRGPFRGQTEATGQAYADALKELLLQAQRQGRKIAGFIAETCPSVGGQLILPPTFLSEAYRYVREQGGVCIADEVQTGYGRMGTDFYAFENHHVTPDIVILGKPIGNGHPLGAVITTPEIAQAFDNGMEYFSTFGGNNVSCAIGLKVLDIVQTNQLQDHARKVGLQLVNDLQQLKSQFPLIGDVRGSGLFLGVELVRDHETLEPATKEARYIVNRMKENGILLGTDGIYNNVLKIRPPMPFDCTNADQLTTALERILSDLP